MTPPEHTPKVQIAHDQILNPMPSQIERLSEPGLCQFSDRGSEEQRRRFPFLCEGNREDISWPSQSQRASASPLKPSEAFVHLLESWLRKPRQLLPLARGESWTRVKVQDKTGMATAHRHA